MSKSVIVNVELDAETRKRLEEWSQRERRSMRQQAAVIVADRVREWVEQERNPNRQPETVEA